MTMKVNPWFKTLMVMAMVIGPMYWLMFTTDGQRRTDSVMLQLFGAEGMELDLNKLDARLSEEELRKVYPELDWQCADAAQGGGAYGGDRVCVAAIGSWNGMPAYRVAFHFLNGHVRAMQLDYRAAYQQSLLEQLHQQLGRPLGGGAGADDGVLQWSTGSGVVVIKEQLQPSDQPALIWLAAKDRQTQTG